MVKTVKLGGTVELKGVQIINLLAITHSMLGSRTQNFLISVF